MTAKPTNPAGNYKRKLSSHSLVFDRLLVLGSGKPPKTCGIYEFWNELGTRVYVGKAVDLNNRLGQYRKPPPGKRGYKAKKIVAAACRLTWTICTSELDALERELHIIQTHRPKFNTSGAFSFMYPYLGIRAPGPRGEVELCFTTDINQTRSFAYWGAFRSRLLTLAAFEALTEVFGYVAHRSKRKPSDRKTDRPYSIYAHFRQANPAHAAALGDFLTGNRDFLTSMAVDLLEKPQARRDAKLVQDWLMTMDQFFDEEIVPLLKVAKSQNVSLPIAQAERDLLFLRERAKDGATTSIPQQINRLPDPA